AFLSSEALAAASRLAITSDPELERLLDEILDLPSRELQLHFPLPSLLTPELEELIEAIGYEDEETADAALEAVLERLDTVRRAPSWRGASPSCVTRAGSTRGSSQPGSSISRAPRGRSSGRASSRPRPSPRGRSGLRAACWSPPSSAEPAHVCS